MTWLGMKMKFQQLIYTEKLQIEKKDKKYNKQAIGVDVCINTPTAKTHKEKGLTTIAIKLSAYIAEGKIKNFAMIHEAQIKQEFLIRSLKHEWNMQKDFYNVHDTY